MQVYASICLKSSVALSARCRRADIEVTSREARCGRVGVCLKSSGGAMQACRRLPQELWRRDVNVWTWR